MPTIKEMSRRACKAQDEIVTLAEEISRRPDFRPYRDNGPVAHRREKRYGLWRKPR